MEKVTQISGIPRDTYAGRAVLAIQKKARGVIGEESVIATLLSFTSLLLINNKFAAKGIFVTDDNREECYIKIIELGDESLITDLEKFINLKDEIKALEAKKDEVDSIILKLQSLQNYDDETQVNQIIEAYLRK